jgi:hypothetical protein
VDAVRGGIASSGRPRVKKVEEGLRDCKGVGKGVGHDASKIC